LLNQLEHFHARRHGAAGTIVEWQRRADSALLLSLQTFATKSASSGLMQCSKIALFDYLVGELLKM
jgi:hypothetical protein